jgi:anti-sigma regulatory factor (Ser/Thr protein kinase)
VAETLSFRIPAGLQAASEARLVVTRALANELADSKIEDVRLMISELVTNGILHGRPGREDILTVQLSTNEVVRVDVIDLGPGFARDWRDSGQLGGWGLQLVEHLADRWGFEDNDTTRVWFEVERAPLAS